MAFTLTMTSRLAFFGDSLTEAPAGNGVVWYGPYVAAIRASYTASRGASVGKRALSGQTFYRGPAFANFGHAGDGVNELLARIAAVYAWQPTHVIVECGVNDVTNGIPLGSFNTAATSIVNGLRNGANYTSGVGAQILWVGPVCAGEKVPFGTNANDTTPPAADTAHTLVEKDSALRTLAGSLVFDLVEFRTDAAGNGLWSNYQQANNTNNQSNQNGSYPTGLTIDGRHMSSFGATFVSNAALAKTVFA